jgi:hypothetical protein
VQDFLSTSAYQIWLAQGNTGTAQDFLNTLVGPSGASGQAGPQGVAGIQGPIGPTGPQGIQGPIGPAGAAGPQGIQGLTGPQGPTGLTGSAGPAGPQGPIGLTGANGVSSLIKTTLEPPGVNCTNGGTKIETGLDANGNGVLDSGEVIVSQTNFICGYSGGQSFIPTQGVRIGFSQSTTWTCPANVTQIQVELWGGGGGGGGRSFYWCSNSSGGSCGLPCACVNGGNKGGNGGNGGYNRQIINVTPGTVYSITIGSGGNAGSNGNKNGNKNNCTPWADGSTGHGIAGSNGQESLFSNIMNAEGGTGGQGGLFGSNFCASCTGTLCIVATAQNGIDGSINNFIYPASTVIGTRTYIPIGYVNGIPSNSSPGGKGATNYNDTSYPNPTAGENGYCIINY